MRKLFLLSLAIFVNLQLFSQEVPVGFYTYKLENGLELYVQEDFTVPTMKIEYITKAGTGRQTEVDTGFYQLYSRLFWKNAVSEKDAYDKLGAGEFFAQSGFSQSRYSFIVPSSMFSKSIALFSNDLKHTRFSDADLQAEFTLLKQEVSSWAQSVPGFINASIDAKVFSKSPWTKDSGVYPALFSSASLEEVRQKISTITSRWYVPDQSALFITGPISAQVVLSVISECFADWQSSYLIGNTSDASKAKSSVSESNDSRLFVLVSNDFSKDYIQSVIQYIAPGLGATNEYSATAWTAAEIMQTKLLEAGMANTNTSFIADAADSRIIIQSLFDAQSLSDSTDISLMVPGFSNIVKSTAQLITDNDLNDAKNRAQLFRNDAYTGADNFMSAVAANWAYGGIEYFFEWPLSVQNVKLVDVKNTFNSPWIFVLVHSDLYERNKDRFDNFGYSTIFKSSGAWYESDSTKQQLTDTLVADSNSVIEYSAFSKSLIKEFSVSSGIDIVTQDIPATPWVSFMVTILGGEILHGENKRGSEQIAVENIANNIEEKLLNLYTSGLIKTVPTLENETEIYQSNISIVCLSDDLPSVVSAVSETIKEASISIAAADELFISSAYNWRIQSGSLEYQLYATAMETLFGGSLAEGLYDSNKELLLQADYNDIKIATELLYDPNRLSIVLTGNIPDTIHDIIEINFGTKNFYPVEKQFKATIIDEQKPIFSPFEQIVRLRHTFLTDVPASLAGSRPTKLIPTTDFSDPAQLYFEIPSFTDMEQALFISLLYEIADRLTRDFNSMRSAPAVSVSVVPGQGLYPVSSLRFSKTKSRTTLKDLIERTFNELLGDLEEDDGELITVIKNRYTRILSRELLTLNDRSHLIQRGIQSSKNPSLYLEKFEIVEGAKEDDFYNVFLQFLHEGEFFWLFSADTAR